VSCALALEQPGLGGRKFAIRELPVAMQLGHKKHKKRKNGDPLFASSEVRRCVCLGAGSTSLPFVARRMMTHANRLLSVAHIQARIHIVRGKRVMLDADLAWFYGVRPSI
jgi:hypothetical protein